MKKIYKYQLGFSGSCSHYIPITAKFLKAGMDPSGIPCVWAEVDLSKSGLMYEFKIIGTGQEVPETGKYIDTFIEGQFVWHVYVQQTS